MTQLLARLTRRKLHDTETLFRYHELLLFLRAYAHNASIVRAVERELRGFAGRVAFLEQQGIDRAPLLYPAWSGFAGTSVSDTFSLHIVRRLSPISASRVAIYWEW